MEMNFVFKQTYQILSSVKKCSELTRKSIRIKIRKKNKLRSTHMTTSLLRLLYCEKTEKVDESFVIGDSVFGRGEKGGCVFRTTL